jgi:hypothetical protein
LNAIKSRLPTRQEILPVFAVFAFFGFSWALYRMFWYVPSWLEYLSLWKVLTIAAYVLAFALVESIVMTGLIALFSLAFPPRMFKDHFVLQGCGLASLVSLASVLLQRKISLVYRLEIWQMILFPAGFLVFLVGFVLLANWLVRRFPVLLRLGNTLAERMTIFAYLYAPLGLLGLLIVIFRNVIGK